MDWLILVIAVSYTHLDVYKRQAETITRVFNLGALPYMVAGTFNLVMAQRLVRRVCSTCKKEISIKDSPRWADSVDSFR